MSIPSVALIGAGSRGKDVYGNFALQHKQMIQFVSVVEPKKENRDLFVNQHHICEELAFDNTEDFFAKGKIADAVIIANHDKQHFEATMKALELGYDILLEKPMSPSPKECLLMEKKAKEVGAMVMVCHVLRYTPFFSKIKEIVDSGKIGDIVNINHTENIGSFHYAHSFARGNWRNQAESSPIILAKSCHDMDILSWLVGSKSKKVSSFGSKKFFQPENAPKGSGERCYQCNIASSCRYNAIKNYRENIGEWPTLMIDQSKTEEALMEALRNSPYGKCVWKLEDHDVCDHQVTILEFENDVKATFTLTAFSNKVFREIRIHGTEGVIEADDLTNRIRVTRFIGFNQEEYTTHEYHPRELVGGHGGGDTGIMMNFCNELKNSSGNIRTSLEHSMESHMMSFAAEYSRLNDCVVNMEEYYGTI